MAEIAYREWMLDDWVLMFRSIYGTSNRRRSRDDIAAHLQEEMGELAEAIRHYSSEFRRAKSAGVGGILDEIPDMFAWLCAVSDRERESALIDGYEMWPLGRSTTWKYPGICPYCLVESDCECHTTEHVTDAERRSIVDERRKQTIEMSVKDLQNMFNRIYGKSNQERGIIELGFHLAEEVGEVSRSRRMKDFSRLATELADIFANLVAMVNICGAIDGQEYRVDDVVWKKYPNLCPACGNNPCSCKPEIEDKPTT